MSPVLHGLYMGDSPVIPEYKLLLVMLEDGAARLDIGRDQVNGPWAGFCGNSCVGLGRSVADVHRFLPWSCK
jgi:hypothetical protein